MIKILQSRIIPPDPAVDATMTHIACELQDESGYAVWLHLTIEQYMSLQAVNAQNRIADSIYMMRETVSGIRYG